jgi:hypothetical protein
LSSPNIISFFQLLLLLDKKGFIFGQKSLDFGPPISLGKFPEKLKEAKVVPCYKKSNALDKSN